MIKDLILKNRSYRRFQENYRIEKETLKGLINLARLSPSARNAQSLKYFISNDLKTNNKIFPCLGWAGYLTNWPGPDEGERPSAYVVMLNDTTISINYFCDHGIAAQSILLGAVEKDLGGCIIASVKKEQLAKKLEIPAHFEILQVIALGKPDEKVVLEEIPKNGDYKYWRDSENIHHVPKRNLKEIVINF